jgi:hypothetical protein
MDALFLSQQYLKDKSLINDNTDWELIQPSLIMIQDLKLQQILGTPLFEDLQTKIIAGTLNSNETNLITKYIQKVLHWYVLMEATTILKYRYTNKGVMVKSSENSQPISETEMKVVKDDWRTIAEEYGELLTKYLVKNSGLFPLYNTYNSEGMYRSRTNFSTGIFLNDDFVIRKSQISDNDQLIDFGYL